MEREVKCGKLQVQFTQDSSAMPPSSAKCPNCGMDFANETSVLKHMNHRFSTCKSFFLRGEQLPAHPNTPDPPPSPPPNPPSHSKVFPDAAFVYGRGNGYMGTFYNDSHADERTSNPYFPFQSKGDWEIASFLSSSGLSMKRIDEFLSLTLVHIFIHLTTQT